MTEPREELTPSEEYETDRNSYLALFGELAERTATDRRITSHPLLSRLTPHDIAGLIAVHVSAEISRPDDGHFYTALDSAVCSVVAGALLMDINPDRDAASQAYALFASVVDEYADQMGEEDAEGADSVAFDGYTFPTSGTLQ